MRSLELRGHGGSVGKIRGIKERSKLRLEINLGPKV